MILFFFNQALGISNMENVHLLKQYFLPYAFCTTCSNTFTEFKSTNSVESGDESVTNVLNKCSDPNHSFRHVYVEQHMIPIILQQFLTDLGIKSSTKTLSTNYSNDNLEKSVNALNSIDINKIEHFWNEYVSVIPFDLELIWDTIVNGLLRYLQVHPISDIQYDYCYLLKILLNKFVIDIEKTEETHL